MTYKLVPFESANVPAALMAMFAESAAELVGNAVSGYAALSIKGKVFHIVRGSDRELITQPGSEDPAASLEVVIVRANPNRSKVYYAAGYVEGSDDKPVCYSNDGQAPAADAQDKQCSTCAACPHNIWGSKITEQGKQTRACGDSRRIAIATPDSPKEPMLLRVPAASMAAMEALGKQLAQRGVPPEAVVVKIGFDHTVAYPQLTFKPVSFIADGAKLTEIHEARNLDVTKKIVGLLDVPAAADPAAAPAPAPAAPAPAPAPAAKKAAPVVKKATPAPAPAPVATVEDAVETAVGTAVETEKVSVKVAPAPTPVAAAGGLEDEIADMLGGLNFDD